MGKNCLRRADHPYSHDRPQALIFYFSSKFFMLGWMTSPGCHPRSVGARAIGYGMDPSDNGPCTWSVDGSRSRSYHQPSAFPTLTLQTSAPAGTAHIHATGRLLHNLLEFCLMSEADRMGQQSSFGTIKSKHRHCLPRIGSSGPKKNCFWRGQA